LVQSEAFSTSFNDSGSCGLSESESGNGQLGHFKKSNVISHCANNDGDSISIEQQSQFRDQVQEREREILFSNSGYSFFLLLLTKVLHEAGDRDGGSVDLGSNKSSHHSLSES
jgi:hypothetical protein